MRDTLDSLAAQWTRLGASFGIEAAAETPDLERLLLDTARHASEMPRLLIMAATWLHRYGDLIAKGRLARLIREELADEARPALALLLESAQQGTHPPQFQSILKDLRPAASPRPLFAVERANEVLVERSRRRASGISRKWGLWCDPIEFKGDALRPARWVMSQNEGFITRADFRGDLRASVLASLRHDASAGESELKLARMAGGSRAQVRKSLDNLEMTGRVTRALDARSRRSRIALVRVSPIRTDYSEQ